MPRISDMPRGTVTFLFTDIEGSTPLWEQHPRAMQAAVAHHDALLREAIESNGGYVFKTVGDAFCAAFPTAPQALEAAIAAQRALNSANWEATGSIKVRMALHTGVAEVRDSDYFGLPLNRVSRLLSTGYGGQILLSLATQQLVRDHLPPNTNLKDLGEGGLKDLVKSEHIYQIIAPGLPADFPALKLLDTRYVEPVTDESGKLVPVHNPYKGLRAFQEADAADFFGREALTERLVARLAEDVPLARFLAIVGPSGSGKSSVVRAGLVPALRQGKLPGSDRWLIVEILPGTHPLEELEAVLLSIAVNPPETLINQLREDDRGLVRAVKRILPRDETVELVLVIDQFEEVFTLMEDEPARVHFLESLYQAVTDERSRLRVVITLRADFFDRPLLYPDPGELMRQRTAVVLPLSVDELERAIVRPAQRVGVTMEAELVAAIVKDVGEQPGTLPLLQYAMTELFDRRVGKLLTLDAYRESGGVLGALARRADEIYEGLNEEEKEAARQLFLRLVTLGEGVEDTRRRVRTSELDALASNKQAMGRVTEAFGKYRLLTFDLDPVTKGATVEVAHEALIRTWDKLREWLDTNRADLRVQRQLMGESTEWERSGRDRSYLSSGARLAQFEGLAEWVGKPGAVALTAGERAYLAASVEERDRQEKAERDRQARELDLQKRAASRLRYLVAGLGLFLTAAIALSGWAVNRSQAADDNAKRAQSAAATAVANQNEAGKQRALALESQAKAEANFTRAEAQRLGDEASALLTKGGSAETIALLSIRSMLTQYSPQGDDALAAASTLAYPSQIFSGHTAPVWSVAFSPDGKKVLTGSYDKTAKLWDAKTGKEILTFIGHSDALLGVGYSSDGKYVVTASDDASARIWEAETGKEVHRLLGHDGGVDFATFSPDSKYVLTGGHDKSARLWDVQTGKQVQSFMGHDDMVNCGAFSPDGKYALTGSGDGSVRLWDAQTGQEVRRFAHESVVFSVSLSSDGKYVATTTAGGIVRIWNAQTGVELLHFKGNGGLQVNAAAFSPDGRTLLTGGGGGDSTVRLWDTQTGQELRRFTDFTAAVWSVTFSRDGRYILAGSRDTTARLWDLDLPAGLPQYVADKGGFTSVVFSPDGKSILMPRADYTVGLWDAQSTQQVLTFTGHTDFTNFAVFSPKGESVLTGSWDGTVRLWDARTAHEVRRFGDRAGPSQFSGVAFSPDGKYVVAGGNDGTTWLWNTQTAQKVYALPAHDALPIEGVAFSPDGKNLLTGGDDGTAALWNLQTGQQIRAFTAHVGGVWGVAFSPDGNYLLTGGFDGTARLWDSQTASPLVTYTGHTGAVGYLAFSPDGKYVLTDGSDNTARLWDTQSGVELRRFAGHQGQGGVAFSPDGRYVLSAGSDGIARLWDLDYHTTIKYLCSKLLRDFSDDVRRQFGIQDKNPTCPAKP